jgi:hypothetical protein
MKMTFASVNCNDFNAKKQARKTASKTWLKDHARHLQNASDRSTTANADINRIILSMCCNAYGVNIGTQVSNVMTEKQKTSIIQFLRCGVNL